MILASFIIRRCLWHKILNAGYIDFLKNPGGTRAKLGKLIGCDCPARVARFKSPEQNYQRFLLRHSFVCCLDRQRATSEQKQWFYQPTISILLPVFKVNPEHLHACLTSVVNQIYPKWQLCIVDDGSQQDQLIDILSTFANLHASKVKIVIRHHNLGIAKTSQQSLELADGDYIAMLDHDDCLAPEALFEVVKQLNDAPTTDWIYSDNDKLNEDGERCCYHPKPCWSPELLLSYNYILHLSVIRRSLVEQVGGFRVGFEGSQDHDLYLRLAEQTEQVKHIPKALYHWRQSASSVAANPGAKSYAYEAALKALNAALVRRKEAGLATHAKDSWLGSYKINRTIKPVAFDIIWIDDKHTYPGSSADSSVDLAVSATQNFDLNLRSHTGRLFCEFIKQSKSDYLLVCSKSIMVTDTNLVAKVAANLTPLKLIASSVKIVDLNGTVDHCGLAIDQQGLALYPLRGWDSSWSGHGAHGALPRNVELLSPLFVMFKRKPLLKLLSSVMEQTTVEAIIATLCLESIAQGFRISVDGGPEVIYPLSTPYRFKLTIQQTEKLRYQYSPFFANEDRYYPIHLRKAPADFSLADKNF